MDISQIRSYFAAHVDAQPGTKIQYGHPSPRFWTPVQLTAADIQRERRERKLFLYIHIPFCPKTDPPACGFCLFAREDYSGYPAVQKYLEYLRRELEMHARVLGGQEVDCVYFGGGTPNVLKPDDYGRVLGWIRDVFPIAPDAEVTLEGVPQLFTRDRLQAMAEAGVTRASIGAQQLKDELLRYSGRKNSVDDVLQGIEISHELGLSVNVDLICGWFDQVEQDLIDDLKILTPLKPESLVIHPLTLAGPSHFAQQKARLPSTGETARTFIRGRQWLHENGYWSSSYTDFMLTNPPRGPQETRYLHYYRDILNHDRLGIGYGGNSLFAGTLGTPGLTYRNIDSTQAYYDAIDAGRLPILEGFRFEAIDLELLYILKGLEGTPYLTRQNFARDIGGDLDARYGDYFSVLRERGWLTVNETGGYELTGEGVFYLPMIQRCISNDRNDQLRGRSNKRKSLLSQVHTV